MRRMILPSVLGIMTALPLGGACAVSTSNSQSAHCQVTDAGKLPAESGGAAALCAAIERAAAAKAPGVAFSADVKVVSSSRLAAIVTRQGRKLPEQSFATMDRDLSASSFERFAAALADQLADGH